MKRSRILFTFACLILSLVLDSCHSTQKAATSRSSKPKFINDIAIAPHNKNHVKDNAIDPKKYSKPVTAAKPKPHTTQEPVTVNTEVKPAKPISNTIREKYAGILGVKPKEINNNALYQFIDKWYGTNYRLGGTDNDGIDCSGFAQKLYGEVYGIDLSRTSREQFDDCTRIKRPADAKEGDLVFFHIHSKHITHVGVYLGNDFFVHSSTTGGVMISSLNEDYWHKYFAGCGRVPRG